MKLLSNSLFASLTLAVSLFLPASLSAQQQQQQKQPLEYIESSSPVAGGGVVTSIYVPGRGAPTYQTRQVAGNAPVAAQSNRLVAREASLRMDNGSTGQTGGQGNGRSVLSPAAVPATENRQTSSTFYSSPGQQNYVGQRYAARPQVAANNPYAVNPYSANVAMRPGLAGCNPAGGMGLAPPPSRLPPSGFSNAASLPPTLGNVGTPGAVFNQVPVVPNGRSTYTPIIPFRRNFPANTYAGQGIFGSPKLYVSGQPIRNFFRYLIIP